MTDPQLPVDSFKEAAPFLRRPFTAAAVKFKVQSAWPKNQPTDGLVVAYIDARLAVERLNMVCPHLWFDEYQPVEGGLLCRLTLDGITRHDIGQGNGKALFSDALKRAAVKFGVGVSLYAIPQSFISVSNGSAKAKGSGQNATIVMTPQGERTIRDRYREWLKDVGEKAFGEALDHGDVEGGQGDAEGEPTPVEQVGHDVPNWARLAGPEQVTQLRKGLAFLLGDEPDGERVADTLKRIEADTGPGVVPWIAGRSVLHAAAILKASGEPAPTADTEAEQLGLEAAKS